jgi:hypothetical protein
MAKIYCPDCESPDIDSDEGYEDRWSYGANEGHYTVGTGTYDCTCTLCECRFGAWWDDDYMATEIDKHGPYYNEETGEVDKARAWEDRWKVTEKQRQDAWKQIHALKQQLREAQCTT